MKPETKLAIRRWTIRKLRLLFDFLDDRLHAAEVRMRDELSVQHSPAAIAVAPPARAKAARRVEQPATAGEGFEQWEARRSGVAPISKKSARRRGIPARAFDLKFSMR
jgi:hypothetical protein